MSTGLENMRVTCHHQLCLTVDNSICRLLCVRARACVCACAKAFLSAFGEAYLFNTLQRDIPRCYFWFLYILCSELLYKELPPLFLIYLFIYLFFSALFLRPTSLLLVLSLSGRIIRNPLGEALISPSSFQTRTHTHTHT